MNPLSAPLAIACITVAGIQSSAAAVVVTASEVLGGVLFEASGSIDLTGLTPAGGGAPALGGFNGTDLQLRVGQGTTSIYTGLLSSPPAFGTINLFSSPDSNISLGPVGVAGGVFDSIEVPHMYTSNDPIVANMTYDGETIQSLGLIPGSYVWTWGDRQSPDSLTLNIVPEPSAFVLGALGLLAFARRKR